MALANYRIMSLAVEGFRGFTTLQTIPFDGQNIFIFGENGLGKSSIIEAIQWCLFGDTGIQVRNGIYEKQECRVVLHLSGSKGNLTFKRELRPGHSESDLRIQDPRGKDVTLREVFPQLAKLRSAERTQVIFAAQHASGRRTREDITDFGRILYFYLNLEDVPDLIEQMSDLIEEQTSESEQIAKRLESVAEGYRNKRNRLFDLIEGIRANPPWEQSSTPTATETDQRIADFIQELAALFSQPFPNDVSSSGLLNQAEEWINLQISNTQAFQSKLQARLQNIEQLAALIPQVREAEARVAKAEHRHGELQTSAQALLSKTSRKAIVNEIERRETAWTKSAAILAVAESVAKLCEKYEFDACPACGSSLDHESLVEHVTSRLEGKTTFDSRGGQLDELRDKLRQINEAAAAQSDAAKDITTARAGRDALIRQLAALAGRTPENSPLQVIELYLAKQRSDLALSRSKSEDNGEKHKQLLRRINQYKQELLYHTYRHQITDIDHKLTEGMEDVRKAFRDREEYLHNVDELKQLVEASFKNALDRAIPPLNKLLTTVYQRLTRQRSFELVQVHHDPAKIGHLELRVASKRRPDKNYPTNVLNGQAQKALHLVPYLVFSQFRPEVLELDLLLIDDPSESFDTSHVALLVEELQIASEHAQLIVASHEQDKFSRHLDEQFDEERYITMVVSDFDPVSGPCIERQ